MALHGPRSVKLQQICPRTWYFSIRHASWSIENQRVKLLDRYPSIRHANVDCETLSAKTATLSIQNTCLVKSCHVVASATYMPAGLMLLPQTPLLFNHAYWLSTVAIWMLVGLWSLNQHACRPFATQYCHSYCAYSVSLSAVPAGVVSNMHSGVVPHYQPWCFIIGHVFWCGTSLSVMHVGVVPHYRPCLLV